MSRRRLGVGKGHKNRPTKFRPGDPRINRNGRPKGSPNKFTTDLKQALLNAFNRAGGEEYFHRHLRQSPRSMLQLLAKLLPTQITGKDGGPIDVLVDQAAGKLGNLSDAELAALEKLLGKAGLLRTNVESEHG